MPITDFQREILLRLKKSRNPESYVAGGTAIQRASDSIRYSMDIDFFHDTDEAVTSAFASDQKILIEESFRLEILITQPSFYRAVVSKGIDSLKLEWVRDTAFRFFPVIEDEEFGYRLHDIDLAVNKVLALANRSELRDVLDILDIDSKVLPLGACVWAACGKDPGFTPALLLDMVQRHANITPDLLAAESLVHPVDPKELKSQFSAALLEAKRLIGGLILIDLGCVYLDKDGNSLRKFDKPVPKATLRHFGSVRGAWPRVVK